jgi:hypothetical protein
MVAPAVKKADITFEVEEAANRWLSLLLTSVSLYLSEVFFCILAI